MTAVDSRARWRSEPRDRGLDLPVCDRVLRLPARDRVLRLLAVRAAT